MSPVIGALVKSRRKSVEASITYLLRNAPESGRCYAISRMPDGRTLGERFS
jgi:hypothetical protein